MPVDWNQLRASRTAPDTTDPRRRMRLVALVFAVYTTAVFARAVQTEWTGGPEYRARAMKPLRRELSVPGTRGRILACDGTVLARDEQVLALAIHYRQLEEPANEGWLRRTARHRLTRAERSDPDRLAAEMDRVLAERAELVQRLTQLAGSSADRWRMQAAQTQARVERIAQSVSERLGRETLVAEQLDYHVMADDLSLAAAAQIEGAPDRFPGVKIVARTRRVYPAGSLAAHVIGYLGKVGPDDPTTDAAFDPDDLVGRAGVETQHDRLLRGRRGTLVELTDHGGRILSTHREVEPGVGKDLVLTLDPALQRATEELLDSALRRRAVEHPEARPGGGAVVVISVQTGDLLVAASAPRFHPDVFLSGSEQAVRPLLDDPAGPLVDRVCRMTLAPGSVFKVVTAAALLDWPEFAPRESLFCQGYLKHPDAYRCAVFARRGTGHGDVTLADALCVSCNVYFFHHAGRMGAERLVDWAARFGFGQPTGVDLPNESSGILPTPVNAESTAGHSWRTADTYATAIGQGSLTATPLQVARMMAAVANGGRLVTPRVLARVGLTEQASDSADAAHSEDEGRKIVAPRPITGLNDAILRHLSEGLRRVVADPNGTGHATIHDGTISVAGKTGTAETRPGSPPHAWFAGYLPAEKPRYVIVIALEHAGDAATAAGPVVKRLANMMHENRHVSD